jgi:hypothetical protein
MSCSCNDCNDITLFSGNPGTNGSNGIFGGQSSKWKFDAVAGTAPGTSYIRFNVGAPASVTTIYINETNFDSTDMSAFLTSFNATGDYGLIRLFKEFDANTFWIGTITNIVDAGTYRTLTVTHTQSNGTFSADDAIVVSFTPIKQGALGAEGSIVATGTWDLPGTTYTAPGSAPGQYANLIYQNTSGVPKTYKVDASFNCGDAAVSAPNPNGTKLCVKAAIKVGPLAFAGAASYEVHNFFRVETDIPHGARQGQAFTIQVTVPNNEYITLEFATSDAGAAPENGRVNSATLYYREI